MTARTPKTGLEIRKVSKAFNRVPVLHPLDLCIEPGRILGLLGQNGAGKSTLMNILGGNLQPDTGEMRLHGAPYTPQSSREARRLGVGMVHQELNLFSNLTISENLFLINPPTKLGLIRRKQMNRAAELLLKQVGLALDPATLVSQLSAGQQQLVELARVLADDAQIVLLDEPTTSLSDGETAHFMQLIRRLAQESRAIIWISHAIDDVLNHCDRVAVLRDGALVADEPTRAITAQGLVQKMIGRPVTQLYPARNSTVKAQAKVILRVDNLSQPQIIADINLELRAGEVLGIFGLMGAGRSEFARILMGLDRHVSGTIWLNQRILRGSPRRRSQQGLGLVTENRRIDGILPESSVTENMSLVAIDRFVTAIGGWIYPQRLRLAIESMRESVQLQSRLSNSQALKTLSGGNQQKTILGKWFLNDPRVLILDEPTRGIDVAAKHEVYQLIHHFADRGNGALVISSDLDELLGICDRLLVMSLGRITGEFLRSTFDRERILTAAFAQHLRLSRGAQKQ